MQLSSQQCDTKFDERKILIWLKYLLHDELLTSYFNIPSANVIDMKVQFFFVGKTSVKYLEEGIQIYSKRLTHYLPVEIVVIPSATTGNNKEVVKRESEVILEKISAKDFVILLDEKGAQYTSVQLADFMNSLMVRGLPKIIFIVGGAFGVSEQVSQRANLTLAFSRFTFTHQMVRLFLFEQIYRAMTIIKNEPYHNP